MSRAPSERSASPADEPAPPPLPAGPLRWLLVLLVLHAGMFLALASPQKPNSLGWPMALVALFLALDLSLRGGSPRWLGRRGKLLRVLACTYPVGVMFAALTGGWVVNTAHVYGALPLPLAYAVTWFGFGTLFGLEVFVFLGLPFALTWRRPLLALGFVPLACTVLQIYAPRFLFFTYGQAMFTVPPLVQPADVLGSAGLNLLYLPLQLVLYAWLRRLYAPAELPLRGMLAVTGAVALAFGAAYGYGAWQMERWAARTAAGTPVELVGIQPNFTLKHLASNPALSHSDREQSLRALLGDSAAALERAPREPGVPTVLLWPESVYPRPYFAAQGMRELVELWVRQAGVHLILASIDGRRIREPDGHLRTEVFGDAVHVGPDGTLRGLYHKIALIPWGERIPLADWIPGYREALLAWIPQISEFTPGREHTVFTLDNGLRIAPMICFDAADPGVAQGMAANGARLGVVLANLAWFGPTSVSNQFGWFARFRAIENRMPILFLSQNGESFLLDARGEEMPPRLPQFEPAAFVQRVRVPQGGSFYSHHAAAIHRTYALALLLLVAFAWRETWLRGLRAASERVRGRQSAQ